MVIMRPIQNSHRVWINEAARKVAELEKQQAAWQEIIQRQPPGIKPKRCSGKGISRPEPSPAARESAWSKKIMPMKDIIERIVLQADALRENSRFFDGRDRIKGKYIEPQSSARGAATKIYLAEPVE